MTHLIKNKERLKRLLCLLVVWAMTLSLIPAPASAADDSIKLTSCDFTSISYHSEALGNASIHTIEFNYGGGATGFCGEHGKKMSRTLIGQTWGHKTEITDQTVRMILAYYYDHTLGKFTDVAVSKGVNNVWNDDYVYYMNAWVQAVVWRYRQGTLGNTEEEIVTACAEELMWVFNCLKNENHTSIDECTAGSETSFRDTVQYIFTLGPETWGLADVYHYTFTGAGNENYPPDLIQSVIIGSVEHDTPTNPETYSLTVRKVDATNTALALPGATFHIVKLGSTDSWTVTTGSDGTYTLNNLTAGTYAVTETAAPNGYRIDNAGPDYVVLPSNAQANVTKVFTDTPTVTVSGSIRKVDRDDPTRGLAGATIAIQGVDNSFYGEYQTGAGGALEGLEWASLTPGTYRAWEISAPEGYSLDPSDVKTFRISPETPEVHLVFKNDAKVKVRLTKLDASDNPLAGAIFNILRDGQLIATEATDANGQITITDVETGTYAFVETFAPDGYAINDQPVIVHVSQADIEGGGIVTVTAVDKRLPDLTIQKKDAATGATVPNTVFEIQGVRTGYRQEVTTGADGSATLAGIPVDYYDVTEKNVPAPYVVSDEPTQTVWLGPGEHQTLVFSNLEEPKLSIMKIDAETSTPIAGVVFSVQGIDVDYSADWTTGADGRYEGQITPGSYRVTETSVPAPYTLSANNVRTVALRAGSEQQLVFENLKNPLLNLTKIDALDGTAIPGTVFSVQGIDNSYSGNWTTGTDGTISERIEPGTYRITEISVPAPYYLPENEADRIQTISLNAGDIRSLVFKDYRTPTLRIYKLDSVSGAPIEGAQFHVTYTRTGNIPDAPATYDFGTLYTNADGEIPLHETGVKLFPGQYTVTETAPAPGFQMREPTTQTVTINGSESRFLTFYNAPLNAIIVEKYDSVTGLAVPGATFRLRYLGGTSGTDGTVIGTKTTGASGSAIWTGLEAGTYVVEEISAPNGYSVTQGSQTVYLSNNGTQSVVTVSFRNSPDGSLLVRKIDAKTGLPMANVEFLVTDSRGAFIGNGNGKFITDASGTILIGNVKPGTTLIVRETRTLPGYILDTTPQTCVVQEGRTTTLEFRNEPEGIIIVYKKDAVTGAALEGVQFTVTTASGEFVAVADGTISSNGVYYTDHNGQIILDSLKPGAYVITETATLPGYVLDSAPHTVEVGANDTQTITLTNRPGGKLIVLKLDRAMRRPLANAQFRIVPADDSLLVNNEGLTSGNHLYTTDGDGQIQLESLIPGAYVITETVAPDGYALDTEAQTITVQSGRVQTVSFYDNALAVLQILKRDAVSGQPLADAEFTVTTVDGTRIGENNGVFVTDGDGTALVTGLQPNSAVIVSETTSPAGYVMDATPKSVIVRSGQVNSLVFNDQPKTTLIVHKYISGTRNEPLAGAEFKVTNSRGEVIGTSNGIYYTDRNGDIMITGLDPGLTVTVRETNAPEGYVLDGTPQSIEILPGVTQELTFWNQRKGSLIIRKLAADTGLTLPGVEFHIAYADGRPVDNQSGHTSSAGRYVTDSRGEIVINDITGVITVTETATVDGYAIDPTNNVQTVVVNPEDAQTLTFTNPRLQTLTITKYIAGTTTPIPGATFLLTDGDGAKIGSANGEFTTDRNGRIVVENLVPGTTVTAAEVSAPDEYVLDGTPQTIRIRAGEAQSMAFYNALKGSIVVRKVDSATGEPLAGAQFKITAANGEAVSGYTGAVGSNGTFTTDSDGQITINRLQPGTYTIRETKAPDGYVIDDQPQTVVLNANDTQTVTFADAPKGSLIIQKFDAATRSPLADAEFKVTKANGELVANNGGRTSSNGIYKTDANGQITLVKLSPGAYVVTEVGAPDGYHLSADAQTVEVTTDDVQTVSFYDEPLAALTIRKQDAVTGVGLAGAVFSVRESDGRDLGLFTTGANGTVDGTVCVSGLTPGISLVVTETKAPDGYAINDTPQTIRIQNGITNSLTFDDQPTATLLIRKVSADTDEPISGVRFKIIDRNGANIGPDDGVFTTDASGEIRIPGLNPGVTVKAREIEAAPGYVLDGIPQDIQTIAGQVQTLTFRNRRQGALVIRKLDGVTNRPLEGATFKITTASGEFVPDRDGRISSNGLYRTDAAGEIVISGVVGTLVVTETETLPGYVINEATRSQTVVIRPNDTQTLTFFNVPTKTLTVQKFIAGTTTPLKGAEFLVTDSAGTTLGASDGAYVTDEYGRFVISDLKPGVTVTVRETKAPDGYVLDAMPKSVAIKEGEAQILTFYDSPKGTLVLVKRDSLTDAPLAGATFQVMTANGQFVASNNEQLSSNGLYTTDATGQVILNGLQPGTYVVRETEAPEGYVLNDSPQTVELYANESATLTFKNAPTQTLTVQKYVSGTTTPLPGVEFLVTDSFGTKIGSNNGKFVTNEDGQVVIGGLVPGSTITVKETKTVDGYILDTTEKSIGIRSGEAQTLAFYNAPQGALKIIKRDAVTNQPLAGATFQVLNSNGEYVDNNGGRLSSNGIYVTDASGEILLTGLSPATLVVRETAAPDGYVLDDTPQTVNVNASETQTLTFRNVPTQTVTVRKYAEGTTTPLQGVRFQITDGGGTPIGNGEYVTNENGEIVLSGIAPGITVIARETKTVRGYALNGTPQNLTVRAGAENALTFYDSPLSTLIIHKFIAGTDNEPLSGVGFKIVDGTGRNVGTSDGVFYTDDNGTITIPNLERGTTVKAWEISVPEGFVLNGTPQDIEIQSSDVHELRFWNQRQGALTVRKLDSVAREPLSGAEFKIAYVDGRPLDNGASANGIYTTNDNGEITISGVNGTFVITEQKAPQGYSLNPDSRTQTVTVNPNNGQVVTFYNDPDQTLTLQKYAENSETPVQGAVFLIKDGNGTPLGTNNGEFTTDRNGQITVSGLTAGTTVTAQEIRAADGYTLDAMPHSILIRKGNAQTLTVYNKPQRTLTVNKFVEGTDTPIQGVRFQITDANGGNIGSGEYVTNERGQIVIPNLDPGAAVTVREVKTVRGYALNGSPQSIVISSERENVLNFYDVPLSTLIIRKYVSGTDNEPLSGVGFKVTDGSGAAVGNTDGVHYTDNAGEIRLENFEAGTTLTVREISAADGFVLDGTPKTVEIRNSDVHELVFWNERHGALTVRKLDSATREPIPGAEFKLAYADGRPVDNANGQLSSGGIYATDSNGEINVTGITGTVVITERKAAPGYTISPDSRTQTVVVNPGDTQTVTFFNTPNQTLTIQKFASDSGEPLAGVAFLVTDADGATVGSSNGQYITDQNGRIVIENLTPGTVITAKETRTVSGYVLDATPQSIRIREGEAQTLAFYNIPKGSLTVRKLDSVTEQPLEGAEFRVETVQGVPVDDNEGRTSTNGIYRTDESGRFTLSKLQPGIYVVTEAKAPDGYVLDATPKTVTVNANDAQTVTFRDTPLQTLVIQKYADDTSKPLAGVTFLLTDANGAKIGEYVTDENGRIVVNGLQPGLTVVAREIRTVEGYCLNSEPQTVRISANGETSLLSATPANANANGAGNSMTFYDTPLAGLLIHKFVEGTDDLPLAGVEFKIMDGTGKAIGATDGVYYTDDNGEILIQNLEIGTTVRVRETKTADGYLLDGTPKDIEIQSSDLHELTFRNCPAQVLVIQKYAEGTTTPIPGTEFLVADSKGTVIGNENGKFVTDGDGRIVVRGLTPGMTVTVKETKAAAGYALDAAPKSIAIQSGDAQTLTFYDTPLTTLTVSKFETGSDRPLSGVAFLITDGDGRKIGNGEYATDENGRVFLDNLEPGLTVIVREIKTVDGYALNGAPQSLILKSGEANALSFYDDPLSALIIRKFIDGTDNEPLSGVEFKVTDGSGKNIGESDGVFYTDDNGEIVIDGLETGTVIKARETKTVAGFVLDGTPKDIEIQSSDVHELVFWNRRQGGLTVKKLDGLTHEPVPGAEFRVAYADGRPVDDYNGAASSNGVYITDDNGEINIVGVTGTIIVTEEKAASGYSVDAAYRTQTVIVSPNETQTLTFYNAPDQSLILQKYEKGTTNPIRGARFLITDGNGGAVGENGGEYVTDENGRVVITGLKPGTTVTAREIEPAEGYVLDAAPKSVTIRSGNAQTLTFYNELCGTLVVVKRDSLTNEPLRGATFQITNSAGEFVANHGGQFSSNGRYVTDESGQIIITGLDADTLVVKEVEAPDGYSLDDTPQTVKINPNDTQTLTFKDVPLQTLVIEKFVDGTTNPLAGVTFLVTDSAGNPVGGGEYVTDENGRIVINGLAVGTTVVAREIRTVKGYHLNGTPRTIQIGAESSSASPATAALRSASAVSGNGNSMTFYDEPLATLVVRKLIDGTENEPLSGVEFKITDGNGKNLGASDGVFYTDDNGEIVVENLEIGTVVKVRETKTLPGFVLDGTPKDIEIQSSDLHELVFKNQRQGALTVRLRDSATQAPLGNAEFRIVYADGRPVDNANGQQSSGGIYRTDENGEINISGITGTIVITQTKTVDGYTINAASAARTVIVNPAETQTIDFTNDPNQTLTVTKIASDSGEPLAGVTFLVTSSDGTVTGPANGEYVTDANGRIAVSNLVPGTTVTVKETKTVSGYVLDATPQSVEIRSGEAQSLTFRNSPKGSLTVRLIDNVTERILPGAEFKVTTAAGTPVDNNEGRTSTNGAYRTDEGGQFTIAGLQAGIYAIVQTKAPEGYVINTEPQTVTVNADDAQTVTFRDVPLQMLTVWNYVAGTTTPLSGSEFLVTDGDGKVTGTDNGIYRTDENGRFVVTGLEPGVNIHVKQTSVTDGYILNGNPQSIRIHSGEAQSLTFYNEPCGTLVVILHDKLTEQPVKGGVFQIMSASGEFIADNGGQLSSNGRYVTDDSGQIIVSGLQPSTLVIRQTESPGGYVLDDTPQTVEVYANDTQTLTFKNVPMQTVIVQKFLEGTTEPLAGVRFLITDGSGENIGVGEYVTDENGRIAIDGIAPGTTVIARETRTVKGYTLNGAPKSLEVVAGQENVLTFYDEPLSTLIVHCYVDGADNEPLANVGFKITDGNDGSIGSDDGVYYTDRAGNIELSDLEPGLTVKVRMFKIAPEYVLDGVPQDIVMESGAVQELTFWAKRQGALTVRVLDSLTREPVPGAEFKLTYADGRPVDTANGQVSSAGQYFTDSNGEISVVGVTGTVVVTQEKPNDKYTIDADNRSKTVTVNPAETQTLTFFDTPAQALTVQLYVRNTTDPIAGARFLLTDGRGAKLGDENGEFVTDENGRFALNGLTPGVTVSAKQLTTADGYLMDGTPKTVEIKSGNAQNLTFYNDPAQTLTVRLYVKGTTTPIAGASFLVRDSGGAFIGSDNGEFTTDRNGEFTITGLNPGVTVTATQTATVSGYVLDTAPQNILIKKGAAQSVTFYNALKGALTVRKLDSVTEEPLQGAEFKITTVQGTPVDNHEGKTSSNGIYVTDADGEIAIEKLEPGVYTVVETKAPDGYALDRTPQTVTVNEDDSQTLTFKNDALQSLTITKYEEGTTKPLAGVTFAVSDSAGNPLGTYTTDANGQITITGLAPGTVLNVREVRTVRGYVLNGEPQTIQIASGGGSHNVTVSGTASNGNALVFYDEPLSALIIRKYIDGTDNEPLSGVEFEITDGRGAAVGNGTYYTDASGEICVENLEPGMTVTVRETKTVAGYVLDGTPKTATIPNSDALEMTFRNRKQGNLVILKQDSETRQPLPGVEFKVVYADGKPVADNYGQTSSEGQYFTDENGEIRISGVVGTVIVTEENAIPGYTIDPNARTKTVTVEPNDTQTITFFNSPKQTLVIQKYASGTTNPIAGAAFYVTDSKGTALGQDGGEFVTDANGRIVLSDLTPGITVTARETRAASGYALDTTPKSIAIQSGNVQTLTFYNTPVQTVTVRKYVRGTTTPIPGVTFIITDGSGAAIGSGEYVTNENGEIVLRDIAPGTVINAREVRTATGYALNGSPQSLTVRSGQNNALTFYDEPLTTLIVRKYVAGTDNEPLANVEFKVTDGSGAAVGPDNGIYRTDAQGEFRIPNLEAGVNITVRETKAPEGYVLDGTPQTIQIKSGEAQSLTFWNSPTQTLTIRKLAEGTNAPLKGVTFHVTDQNAKPLGSANGEFTTDEDGKIVITGLTPGDSVTAIETKAADGYVLDATPKSIVIRSGEAQTLTVYNSPKGTLIITKRDKVTEAPLKGATFQVMTADGKFVANAGGQLSSNGIYTTDDKGQIIITDLDSDTLVVRETKAPDGYLLDDTPQTVKVGPKDTQTLTFYDEPEKVLTIQKYEEGTTKPIQGVMFLVTDSSGATVGPNQGEYATDRNGRIVLTGLTPGTTITAKEIRTTDGYVLDTTPQSVLIKAGEAQTMTFYNAKDGGVEIIKLDGADKTKRLPNTTFEIRKQDGGLVKKVTTGRDGRIYASLDAGNYYLVEIEAAEGYKIDPTPEYFTVTDGKTTTVTVTNVARSGILLHKTDAATGKALYGVTFLLYDSRNNPIGQYSTDNMGYVRILDLEAGQYFLRELENKGYIPDTQMKTVYVKSGETTLIEWKNTPIMGQIQITKKSADYNPTNGLPAGTPLEGAVFQIFDKAGNVVDTVQTDSRGVANSKPLPLDRYTFKEMTAPAYYGVNETEFTAYLEHEGQIERFEVTDKSLVTGVSINKTGPKEAMAGQPVNYRFDHIGNTSNVRLEKFYWRDVLPPQVRLQKIVTGTYNFPGNYMIMFRVNGGELRTLADNLSTSRNYTLDASPTALGLASNEMVTEVMFVFGQVPGGFAQVEAPAILCNVIPNVLAPSFVNAADVGGLYNGQWIQGVSRWTTTVYRKPVKLPRTGY